MNKSADHEEALGWLADRVKWERLLDELRAIPTPSEAIDLVDDEQAA
jgi:mannitol/fructose-specific phosphotransferase system IIA component (Ntr-type)